MGLDRPRIRYGRKLNVGYEDGERLPGGVLAIYSGD